MGWPAPCGSECMKSRILLAFLLFVLAGILGPGVGDLGRRSPALSWVVADIESGHAQHYADSQLQLSRPADLPLRIYAQLQGGPADAQIVLSGVGVFRCRARDGTVAPHDLVVPLDTGAEAYDVSAPTARPLPELQLRAISCGRHRLPGRDAAEELFPDRGTAVLRAWLDTPDGARGAATLTLTLDVRQ
jgi:hypothetical protein